ncbi:hypothetical protein Syun_029735 [Stephania yunnanensis]|uniref:Uncharacterized protein n=1 Tax=Stephania yunnanensis TaxID=152371 RepID=A0AAP0E665_9MAGN
MKISKSALEARAARMESKPMEEGKRSVQRRERRDGSEREEGSDWSERERGRRLEREREEDGENLQFGASGEEESKPAEEGRWSVRDERDEEGAERSGEVDGAEREKVGENLSNSALAARRESDPAEDGRRSVQRRCVACRGGRCMACRGDRV